MISALPPSVPESPCLVPGTPQDACYICGNPSSCQNCGQNGIMPGDYLVILPAAGSHSSFQPIPCSAQKVPPALIWMVAGSLGCEGQQMGKYVEMSQPVVFQSGESACP